MRNQATTYLDSVITFLLLLVAGLTPLLFFNQTTEFFEMPKLVFLLVCTLILLGLWIFSWIVKGKIVITRTPLDIPLLVLLGVILLSTYLSTSRFSSIYGDFPNVHGSAVAWITYILLYFVTVSHLKSLAKIRTLLYVMYVSGILVAILSFLSFFGLYLPIEFVKAVNFTPTGSTFSTVALLLLLLPLPLLSILNINKYMPLPMAIFVSVLFGVTIALIGSLPVYIALLIIVALCVFVSKPSQVRKTLPLFLIPIAAVVVILLLAYWPSPLPQGINKLQVMEANYPKEIQLPFAISWKVSASAFRDAPFIGTGPSTYLFNFTSYKPVEFNLLNFWNFSFDKAYNEFLQVLGTLGIIGFLALLTFCAITFVLSWRNLSLDTTDAQHDAPHVLLPALAISGIVSIILLAIHAATLVSIVVTFLLLAAFMGSQKSIREKVMELSMGIRASTAGNRQFDLFPIIMFIIFVIVAARVLYSTVNVVLADYYHRQALSLANSNGTLTYKYLQKAESLSPEIDLYRVDMAQTNFALANALASQKAPAKGNSAGTSAGTSSATLTDQDKKTIQTLLSQSVNEGRASVALSPRSARNWEVLASIYRNITGVAQNALAFSLDAYGRAIQRDPLNPALRVSVGGIYYSVKNYDLAIRFFSDAANLKPDYANAYYNLTIALRDKGDLQNAKLVAEQMVGILKKDTSTPDYKTATKLLGDLNAKIVSTQKAPAAASSSALQAPIENVNVSNLNNPPSVTPAPSVKPNPNANLPRIPSGRVAPTAAPGR